MNSRAAQFFQKVELENSKIRYPDSVIFLCGGNVNNTTGTIKSLRDFIYKNRSKFFPVSQVVLAEKASAAFDSRIYDDLLQFESYLASVSRLVLLVSESEGSIAELGAFSQIQEISTKLLVFIHSQFYGANSFIKDGPIRFLENANEQSVQEFDWAINRTKNIPKQSAENLIEPMQHAIQGFTKRQPLSEKFDRKRIGHQILLVAGVIYTLRCCKFREIAATLNLLEFECNETDIKRCIFCLDLYGWIKIVKRETKYYMYQRSISPFVFRGLGTRADFDAIRVRHDVLNAYESTDPRLTVIDSVAP